MLEWSLLHNPGHNMNSLLAVRTLHTDKRTDVCSRPLCSYSGIFSPKKNWFFWDKIFFQNFFWKILTLFYATFQCGRYNVKKIQKKFFLPMKNWKNHPKKLLRIGPDHFFPLTSQGHSPQPKIDFPYHEISGPDICSLICDLEARKVISHQKEIQIIMAHNRL